MADTVKEISLDRWTMENDDLVKLVQAWEAGKVEVIGNPMTPARPLVFILTEEVARPMHLAKNIEGIVGAHLEDTAPGR